MDVTAEDFRRHYESLSDEALLDIDTGELTELARSCHAEELERRGIETDSGSGEAVAEPASDAAVEEMICIVEYDYPDEADLARGMLEASEIPARVENEPGVSRLMVPAKFGEQALVMLATPLSDEELAAQAEAAANPDFEEEQQD